LAAVAQAWADTCPTGHNLAILGTYGENIYECGTGFPGCATITETANSAVNGVLGWATEAANYNYAANTCSSICGHYTQLVWRTTTLVGCGAKTCTSPYQGTVIVCNYQPPGNFNGLRPYCTATVTTQCAQ
jgi:hypothetical protein